MVESYARTAISCTQSLSMAIFEEAISPGSVVTRYTYGGMFHSYLARSAKLPEGLYILPMFFSLFLFFYFFSGRLRSPAGSEATGLIFTKISGLVDRRKGLITLSLFDFSRDVATATN